MKIVFILCSLFFLSAPVMAEEHQHGGEHEHSGHGGHEEGGVVKLTPAQIEQGGIQTRLMQAQQQMKSIRAPGVVAFNGYALADITTLVDGTVYRRLVRLGDQVQQGQALLILNSTVLAQAEANYLKARAEHHRSQQALNRLQKLAKQKIVSQARLQQAESTYQSTHAHFAAAKATLFSYGLSKRDVESLLEQEAYGLLTLRAPHSGTVVADNFRLGQHLPAGQRLMQIVDESSVWVEVKIPEMELTAVRVGQAASVTLRGQKSHYSGQVVSIHHELDAVTRTAGVRLEVQNPDDTLHPGMFVRAEIATQAQGDMLLLPEEAVQRQGSELIVFVEEEPGHFERREVEVGEASMGMLPVLKGVKEGELVVVKGAFVLASELAKAGFEVHNH